MVELTFAFFAILALFFAILAILNPNPIFSSLYLVVSFLSVAGIYFVFHGIFIGIMQILLYAGAVLVLFTYTILLMNLTSKEYYLGNIIFKKTAPIVAILFLLSILVLFYVLYKTPTPSSNVSDAFGTPRSIAKLIFYPPTNSNSLIYSFEFLSVLILAVMTGIILIARRRLR